MTSVQIPDEMVRELLELTGHDTPEKAVLSALEWWIKERRDGDYLRERAARGSWQAFDTVLAKAPDVDPTPGDRLPQLDTLRP